MKSISRDRLGDVTGGQGLPMQSMQQSMQSMSSMQSFDGGPKVGASSYQPPGAGYHVNYGPWKNGSASSYQTVSNKDGSVIDSGQ
jgi:hypothetical protein